MNKDNLLVIGASGGVANAFLQKLPAHRDVFNKLILIDKRKNLLKNKYLDHKRLDYKFIHKKIILPTEEKEYLDILKKYQISIVIDLTDMDSIPIIESTDKSGAAYINTAMNDKKKEIFNMINEIISKKSKLKNSRIILCSGMNPGVVNVWARYGIEKFGVPGKITHFEYDTSKVAVKSEPIITWCLNEYLMETVVDPSGFMMGRNRPHILMPNGLEHKQPLRPILSPIFKMNKYPYGFTVLHEENITLANKYNIPSKFIYAINMKTMEKIMKIYRTNGKVKEKDLFHGDNSERLLSGADNIGVMLDYKDKIVYYFNSIPNEAIIGTNATYSQVIVGVFSALFTMVFDKIKKGIYFPEDLYNTRYKNYIFNNIRTQEFVFKKRQRKLILKSHNPQVVIRTGANFERIIY